MVTVMFGPPGRPFAQPAIVDPTLKASIPAPRKRMLSDPLSLNVRKATKDTKIGMSPRKIVFSRARSKGFSYDVVSFKNASTMIIKKRRGILTRLSNFPWLSLLESIILSFTYRVTVPLCGLSHCRT